MKSYASVILFFVVLAAPFVLRRVVVQRSQLNQHAAGSATRRLVVITPHNQDIRREFAPAFSDWHQKNYSESVEIDFRVPGGTNDVKRQLADVYAGWRNKDGSLDPRFVPDIHVVWGGGPFFFDVELKPLGILKPIQLDRYLFAAAFPQPTLAGVRLYESSVDASGAPTPKWVGVCLSAFGIIYNSDIYRRLGVPAPTRWSDLTDPRLAGQLALADPTHSGSAATAYMIIIERRMADAEQAFLAAKPELSKLSLGQLQKNADYVAAISSGWKRGMGDLLLIAANARYFTDSSPVVPNDIGNGDAAAGIGIDFYGRVYEDVVGSDRCRVVLPAGATAITPDPVGILEGVSGHELELATHFVEFLLTPGGQRLWILRPGAPGGPVERGLRRPPVRWDLYADRSNWTDDANPFEDAHGFNQRRDFESLFADTRQLWTAAWIDGAESLKKAYDTILRVSDADRRAKLLAELADLPITMQEVEQTKANRELKANNDPVWKAQHLIELTKRFRAHFDRIRDLAE